jgi:hypothetical protein
VTTSGSTSWKAVFTSPTPGVIGSDHCESTSLTISNN